jgi:hypothetical protein
MSILSMAECVDPRPPASDDRDAAPGAREETRMEVLNISTYPYNDPMARWSCRVEKGQLLLIVGSDQDRICLALTRTDAHTLLEHVQDFLAQMKEE